MRLIVQRLFKALFTRPSTTVAERLWRGNSIR